MSLEQVAQILIVLIKVIIRVSAFDNKVHVLLHKVLDSFLVRLCKDWEAFLVLDESVHMKLDSEDLLTDPTRIEI